MPLLNRNRHLDDGALSGIWSEAVATGQPASDPHLASCADCRARYARFTTWLDRVRDDAWADADEVFPADRLATQQAHVMRRLEMLERPARVIAFPRFTRPMTSTQGHVQRWIAAAAAAGLVIGLAAGQFVDIRHTFGRPYGQPRVATPPTVAPQATNAAAVVPATYTTAADEALFLGAESPATFVRVTTLRPMDDITPRARDLDRPR